MFGMRVRNVDRVALVNIHFHKIRTYENGVNVKANRKLLQCVGPVCLCDCRHVVFAQDAFTVVLISDSVITS